MSTLAQRARGVSRATSWLTVGLALAVGTSASGCLGPTIDENATRYVPETAGVVMESQVTSTPFEFQLSDGRTIPIGQEVEFIDRATPLVGDLLLTGSKPSPWVASVPPVGAGCFKKGGVAFDRGDWVEIEISVQTERAYLRVPKAGTWSGGGEAPGEEITGGGVCLDAQGRAFAAQGHGRY